MVVFVIGANHKTASMEALEKYFLSEDRSTDLYKEVHEKGFYFEMVPMQTCNRMELYFATDKAEIVADTVKSFFKLSDSDFSSHFYFLYGKECIQHLMEVVSSLDSVVLGESQILGQVRDSYLRAKEIGYTSKVLNRLFEQTVKTGKRVRSETGISKGAVSISQAAVELGRKVFRGLEKQLPLISIITLFQILAALNFWRYVFTDSPGETNLNIITVNAVVFSIISCLNLILISKNISKI